MREYAFKIKSAMGGLKLYVEELDMRFRHFLRHRLYGEILFGKALAFFCCEFWHCHFLVCLVRALASKTCAAVAVGTVNTPAPQ